MKYYFLDGYSTRNFSHQYPASPFIIAQYITGNRTFYFWYKVVSLGYYPTLVKLTQKNSKDCIQYQIPDNYIVETEVSKMKIRCETKYQPNGKVRFTIAWKEDRAEWSIYSDRSATSVTNAFLKALLFIKIFFFLKIKILTLGVFIITYRDIIDQILVCRVYTFLDLILDTCMNIV
jgi:hypothetical protein